MVNAIYNKGLLLLAWMALAPCLCKSQVTIGQNMYQANDLTERQQLAIESIWESTDALADLQHMAIIGESALEHMELGTDTIAAIGNGGMAKYKLDGDSLLLVGTENRLMHIDYALPEIWLRFPMCLGDSVSGLFEGKGQYCERLFLRKAGRYSTKADALGTLVLENCDTIHNVLRLRTERVTTTLAQPLDSMLAVYGILDSIPELGDDSIATLAATDDKAIRTVTMRYYAPGCRYPVLETNESGIASGNGSPAMTAAYYCSPFSQTGLASASSSLQAKPARWQDIANTDERQGNTLSYSLLTNTSSRTIAVTFDAGAQTAGRSCPIRLLLCDRQGILYRQTSGSAISGELTELSLSYAGLSHGQYVLYIEACGKQYSEIFSVN